MSLNALNRKLHYWTSALIAIPVLVIIGSGLVLQTKKHWSWVQPTEVRGTGTTPSVGLDAILASVQALPDMNVRGWQDVNRLDVRPSRGVAKVWLRSGYEVQVDLGTGRVLQSAYRRSDLIESIHDGSFFGGDWTKLGMFLPAGIALFLLWCTGIWMWWLPLGKKWRSRQRAMVRIPRNNVVVAEDPAKVA